MWSRRVTASDLSVWENTSDKQKHNPSRAANEAYENDNISTTKVSSS
jgi:hypothetical protein